MLAEQEDLPVEQERRRDRQIREASLVPSGIGIQAWSTVWTRAGAGRGLAVTASFLLNGQILLFRRHR